MTGGPSCSSPTSTTIPRVLIEIMSAEEDGAGSIRAAIDRANILAAPVEIVSRLPPGTIVEVSRQLPPLVAPDARLEANGLVLKEAEACVRPDGRPGCDGLLVTGPRITVRNLQATKFTFDGIEIRGSQATDVTILGCYCTDNRDDGIGIARGAGPVEIVGGVFERNGFGSKGKGVLVFEDSIATLRGNIIRANRDGVTISDGAHAFLIGNEITDNADKGLGVRGATLSGRRNTISRNGAVGPNGDGMRITRNAVVTLYDIVITDSADTGVVVLDESRVLLAGGRVSGNNGWGIAVRDEARVELMSIDLRDNVQGQMSAASGTSLDLTCGPIPAF